jgi:ribosomal protein S18 acetylase RimI-like enzyme
MSKIANRILVPGPELLDHIVALLPRLASFELPPRRHPPDLWQGDEKMLRSWFAGHEPTVHVYCTQDAHDVLSGVAMFSLRDELLSGEPSAHLEALAVADGHEGQGIGTLLLDACHRRARELGARSMTLHVFDTNRKALGLYAKHGYDPELRRCIKWL